MTTTDWPYDARQDDPLTALRIAVVPSSRPDWSYITAFDVSNGQRPTGTEAEMIASFTREYIEHWYTATWKMRLAERPFDIDGSANGITFRKWGEDDWGYRRRTWTMGPLYVPQSPQLRASASLTIGPMTLVQVMDRAHSGGEDKPHARWTAWKAAHPEVFGDA
jgi:hypothetical protein